MKEDPSKPILNNKNMLKTKSLWIKRPKLSTPLTKELIDHETLPNCFTESGTSRLNTQALNLLFDIKESMYSNVNTAYLPNFEVDLNHVDLISALNEKIVDTEMIHEMLIQLENQSKNYDSIKDEIIRINKTVLNPLYLKIKYLNDNQNKANKKEMKYLRKVFRAKEGICTELISILNEVKGLDEAIRECVEYKDTLEMINK